MVSGLSPGCTVLAISNDIGVVGFNNGGISKFDRLLKIKYAPKIKDSILEITGASPDDTVWYENESAVRLEFQGQQIGSAMSRMRMKVMLDLAPDIVCGRTLNPHWLKKRGEHLTEAGYRFDARVPDGETFKVGNNFRSFYWGIRQPR